MLWCYDWIAISRASSALYTNYTRKTLYNIATRLIVYRCVWSIRQLRCAKLLNENFFIPVLSSTLITESNTKRSILTLDYQGYILFRDMYLSFPYHIHTISGPDRSSIVVFLNRWYAYIYLNSVVLVRKRIIPTELPQPVGEVSANFSW
jgi:hypothetical protein